MTAENKLKLGKSTAFFAACLVMLILIPLFLMIRADNPVCGDVDGDGDADFDDARLIFDYVAGSSSLTLEQLDLADVNGDGKVTVIDAAQIYHYASGVLSSLPYRRKGRGTLVILSYPQKTEYNENEPLDLTGFSLGVEYENDEIEVLADDAYTCDGYSAEPGVKIIVASYEDARVAFIVTVYPSTPESIEIVFLPSKLTYSENEALDLTGLNVVAHYQDGTTETVSTDAVSVFDYNPVSGEQTVTVVYRTRKAYFTVTVLPSEPTISSEPEESSEPAESLVPESAE